VTINKRENFKEEYKTQEIQIEKSKFDMNIINESELKIHLNDSECIECIIKRIKKMDMRINNSKLLKYEIYFESGKIYNNSALIINKETDCLDLYKIIKYQQNKYYCLLDYEKDDGYWIRKYKL
jgi:hypothetical protein